MENYESNGDKKDIYYLDYFYDYFMKHKDRLTQILELLYAIEKLGFYEIEFNENIDFTKEEYKIDNVMINNFWISYLDNIEIVLSYSEDLIYRTKGSNYKIKFAPFIAGTLKSITVNSLLFDAERLPKTVSKEDTAQKIFDLRDEYCERYKEVLNYFNLNGALVESKIIIANIDRYSKEISEQKIHDSLVETLKNIIKDFDTLQKVYDDYSDYISINTGISKERLAKEKRLCFTKSK